jgi:hypothetical protein
MRRRQIRQHTAEIMCHESRVTSRASRVTCHTTNHVPQHNHVPCRTLVICHLPLPHSAKPPCYAAGLKTNSIEKPSAVSNKYSYLITIRGPPVAVSSTQVPPRSPNESKTPSWPFSTQSEHRNNQLMTHSPVLESLKTCSTHLSPRVCEP